MTWGIPNRPKISNRVENRPTNREGTDGDIQIKGTGLGAKLFAKWSSRWWDVPLSIDGVTKIGVIDSDYLSIDRDSVDIYKNSVKVASFGETTTVGNFSATSAGVVTVSDINLSGKVVLDDDLTNVIIGKTNTTGENSTKAYFEENVVIGHNAASLVGTSSGRTFLKNVAIGYNAMRDVDPHDNSGTSVSNVAIGHGSMYSFHKGGSNTAVGAGALLGSDSTGSYNIGIGYTAGGNIEDGSGNVVIGDANVTAVDGDNQLIIASGNSTGGVTWMTGDSSGNVVMTGLPGMILGYTRIQNDDTDVGDNIIAVTTTMTVLRTVAGTECKVTFVAPPSEKVEIQFSCQQIAGRFGYYSLSSAAIYAEVDEMSTYDDTGVLHDETDAGLTNISFQITSGLNAGTSYTRWIAAKSNATTFNIQHGRASTTGTHDPPIIIKAIALPATIVTGE